MKGIFKTGFSFSSDTCLADTAQLQARFPAKASIEHFKADPDFQYGQDVVPIPNWWEQFWRWLWKGLEKWLDGLFKGLHYDNFWQYIFIAIIAAVATWIVLKLMGVNVGGIFRSRNTQIVDLPYETVQEDVRVMNFESLIEAALEQRNFRLAVRLLYLKILRDLNDKGFIVWKPEKTNRNYLQELSSTRFNEPFQLMTYRFEYVWYGEFNLEESDFNVIRKDFMDFHQQVKDK